NNERRMEYSPAIEMTPGLQEHQADEDKRRRFLAQQMAHDSRVVGSRQQRRREQHHDSRSNRKDADQQVETAGKTLHGTLRIALTSGKGVERRREDFVSTRATYGRQGRS